jgi:hypothetical protein
MGKSEKFTRNCKKYVFFFPARRTHALGRFMWTCTVGDVTPSDRWHKRKEQETYNNGFNVAFL